MPPKKSAADPPASDAPVEDKKSNSATHPSTAVMVKEALKALDSRKGVSSHAIQTFIGQKHPSVDLVRLKHLVRRALKKGIETGTLVRPANSNVTTGATGKFRLAPNTKEAKTKTENVDPNVLKDEAKKLKKAGAAKKRDAGEEEDKSKEAKPPKKSKKEKEATTSDPPASKVAPAKKPKAKKKVVPKVSEDGEEASEAPEAPKGPKAGRPTRNKVPKAGADAPAVKAPAVKAPGRRGKKAEAP
ncbi:protein B4 [Pungitius pungitius]|uniref:protein B4 n=1 Tax=Pungitius pungitius TaxID=134920 RepID=UPI002E10DD5B